MGGQAGGRAAAPGWQTCTRVGAGAGAQVVAGDGKEDLRLDASAVVGERGQLARLSGGANEQLIGGGDWIVPFHAAVLGLVSRGGHDQHLRFVKSAVCLGNLPQLAAGSQMPPR